MAMLSTVVLQTAHWIHLDPPMPIKKPIFHSEPALQYCFS